MHKPHEEMSDEELVDEWELTHADKIVTPPGARNLPPTPTTTPFATSMPPPSCTAAATS